MLQIHYIIGTEGGFSKYLFECKFLALPEPGPDDGLMMTPESVLEPSGSGRTSSGSGGNGSVGCRTLACTAATGDDQNTIVRKKRSSVSAYRAACRPVFSPVSEISAALMNRRKGNPQRAPLYWICVRIYGTDYESGKGGFKLKLKYSTTNIVYQKRNIVRLIGVLMLNVVYLRVISEEQETKIFLPIL